MDIRVTLPDDDATGRDRYSKVTITPDSSPVRFEFSFMVSMADWRSVPLYVCMEVAVQQLVDDPAELDEYPNVNTAVMRDLAQRFDALEEAARMNLALATHNEVGTPGQDPTPAGETRFRRGAVAPRRRRELTDEFLRDIAERYRGHLDRGMSPALALSREERVSVRTVRNWLKHARDKDLLGPGERGRAGEHPPTSIPMNQR